MPETLRLALMWLAGAVLGAIFFGGLWWTVRQGASAKRPALWFLGSLALRTTMTLAGFYFVSGPDWRRLLLCLLGFVMARPVVTWLTRPSENNPDHPEKEASHAPQS